MRPNRVSASILIGGLALLSTAPAAGGAAPAQPGNCVSHFTSTLGQAGVAGSVIRVGAKDLAPFGRDVVRLSPYVRRHLNVHGHYSFQLPDLSGARRAMRGP